MILILIPVAAVAMVGIGAGVIAYRKSLDKHHHVLSSAYVRSYKNTKRGVFFYPLLLLGIVGVLLGAVLLEPHLGWLSFIYTHPV